MKNKKKHKRKRISYRHRIAITILSFSLLPCILLGILYLKSEYPKWVASALSNYQNLADSNALLISKNMLEMQSKMEYVLNDSSVRSSIRKVENIYLSDALDLISTLNKSANSIKAGNNNLQIRWYPYHANRSYGSYCYTLDQFCSEFPNETESSDYQTIIKSSEQFHYWMVRNVSRGINNSGPKQYNLCLYAQMTNLSKSNCVLELSIPVDNLVDQQTMAISHDSLFAVCIDQDQKPFTIILNNPFSEETANTLIERYRKDGMLEDYLVVSAEIPGISTGEAIFILPTSDISNEIAQKIMLFIGISLCVVVVIIFTSYSTSFLLTKRIIATLNSISMDLDHIMVHPIASNDSVDDIGQISQRVQALIQTAHETSAKIERYEAEKLRMELELLQMRFNPHLLYNTLSAIQYLAKSDDVRNVVESLCHYYRIILSNGHILIRVHDEFEMIREYLLIEKFSYRLHHLSFEFEIDDQVTDCTIIKHLLQPIVENALMHGLRPSKKPGVLKISAKSIGETINITITDNGIGMSPEQIKNMLSEPPASSARGGYGVYNVQQRIQVYYGSQYGLTIQSIVNQGTTVEMTLPKVTQNK